MIDDDAAVVQQADAGDDGVIASGEQAQHGAGVGGVIRLFQNLVIDYYCSVGAQDDFTGTFPGGFGFGAGEAADVGDGIFGGGAHFFDWFYAHGEMESGHR